MPTVCEGQKKQILFYPMIRFFSQVLADLLPSPSWPTYFYFYGTFQSRKGFRSAHCRPWGTNGLKVSNGLMSAWRSNFVSSQKPTSRLFSIKIPSDTFRGVKGYSMKDFFLFFYQNYERRNSLKKAVLNNLNNQSYDSPKHPAAFWNSRSLFYNQFQRFNGFMINVLKTRYLATTGILYSLQLC